MTEKIIKDASGNILRTYIVDGNNVPAFYLSARQIQDIVLALPNMFCRKDDLMLCTYPKTGTNWVYEIMMMLLRGSSKRISSNKIQTMLEVQPVDMIEDVPSPRILNTHLSPRFLPKELVSKQIKTVLVVRNPKDTAVSYFNHMTGLNNYKYHGKWNDWFPLYIHGQLEYGKYTTYLREWEEIIDSGVKFPLHVVYYEDLHKDSFKEVWRLAQFLNVKASNSLIQEIVDMCSFDKMGQEKFHPAVKKVLFTPQFKFFRKGKVGDWKNWFTAEQRKVCDKLWEKEMSGSKFQFVYDETELKSRL